ncbi:hypothetical protein SLA2020_340330 [Shorea laevis]
MGSVEVVEQEREFDVEETIFVAVGKSVEESKTTLFWAAQNFAGKKICVLHVYQPKHVAELTDINLSADRLKQQAGKTFWEVERQKLHELLDQYLLVLVQAGVEADKVWIEMDNVEKGIVDIIARHNIRWLVMGGAAEKYYSKKLAELKSKKAFFVCQQAPISCNVWFVCKGHLIYTRGGRKDKSVLEIAHPLLLLNLDIQNEQSENLESETLTDELRFVDADGDVNDLERVSRGFGSQCSVYSSWSTKRVVGTSKLALCSTDELSKEVSFVPASGFAPAKVGMSPVRLDDAGGSSETSFRSEGSPVRSVETGGVVYFVPASVPEVPRAGFVPASPDDAGDPLFLMPLGQLGTSLCRRVLLQVVKFSVLVFRWYMKTPVMPSLP